MQKNTIKIFFDDTKVNNGDVLNKFTKLQQYVYAYTAILMEPRSFLRHAVRAEENTGFQFGIFGVDPDIRFIIFNVCSHVFFWVTPKHPSYSCLIDNSKFISIAFCC